MGHTENTKLFVMHYHSNNQELNKFNSVLLKIKEMKLNSSLFLPEKKTIILTLLVMNGRFQISQSFSSCLRSMAMTRRGPSIGRTHLDGSRAQMQQLHCDLQSKYKGKFSPDSKIERKTLILSDVSI